MLLLRRIPSDPGWSGAPRVLDEARREMDRLFETLAGAGAYFGSGVFPPINVTETPERIRVRAELPGIDKDALDVTVENDTLTIAGEREMAREDGEVSFHRREREWGSFRRSFSLPTKIDADKVEARYLDGVLTVDLPKGAEVRPKQITVQAGN